jgi:F-type H+-transporting ATPase subunit alpha
VPVEKQVVYVYVATGGYLDDLPVEDAKRYVEGLAQFLETRHPDVLTTIQTGGDLDENTEATLKEAIASFAATFVPSTGVGAGDDVDARLEAPIDTGDAAGDADAAAPDPEPEGGETTSPPEAG